jgi:hypothetical protein
MRNVNNLRPKMAGVATNTHNQVDKLNRLTEDRVKFMEAKE